MGFQVQNGVLEKYTEEKGVTEFFMVAKRLFARLHRNPKHQKQPQKRKLPHPLKPLLKK